MDDFPYRYLDFLSLNPIQRTLKLEETHLKLELENRKDQMSSNF